MGQKKISELQLISLMTDGVSVPGHDGIQTYRVTGAQLKAFILAAGNVLAAALATDSVETIKIKDKNVTLGKLLDIATQKIIARGTSGSGSPEEIALDPAFVISSGVFKPKAGGIVQEVYSELTTQTAYSSYTAFPQDDTIPQNTEGVEVMTATITPTDAANYLLIETSIWVGENGNTINRTLGAIFRDSTANAIAAGLFCEQDGEYGLLGGNFIMRKMVTAGSTSATTFKVRIGDANAGSFRVNGHNGGRLFGGVYTSTITIKEIKA